MRRFPLYILLSCFILIALLALSRISKTETIDSKSVQQDYFFKDAMVSKIYVQGAWDLRIHHSDDPIIKVDIDQEYLPFVDLYLDNETLYAIFKAEEIQNSTNLQLEVYSQNIETISLKGISRLTLHNCNWDTLKLKLYGTSAVHTQDCNFRKLEIIQDGASSVKMERSSLSSVHLEINGATSMELHFHQGKLSGFFNGAGLIRYSGDIEDNQLILSGVAQLINIHSNKGDL